MALWTTTIGQGGTRITQARITDININESFGHIDFSVVIANPTTAERTQPKGRMNSAIIQIKRGTDVLLEGFIEDVDQENRTIRVAFDGQSVEYKAMELDELNLAYACSIHKSQGSEYPAVVILLATQHYHLLQRNLLYTAITRGRQLVCLLGSRKAVKIATLNNRIIHRQTALCQRLQDALR